ncbi:MAG TPA: alpha/beta hydrolase, partial [Hanamia sp.]|nr:alpha/beta hydrolase [Hanamia sp.]
MMKFIFLFYGFFLLTYNSFAQANKYTPRIEYCSCRFRIDSNFVKSVPSPKIRSYFSQPLDKIDSSFKTHCGYLIVPENRKKLRSNMVKLPFIIIESKNPHKKADPVLFAAGGPGGSILSWTSFMTNSPMIHDRDLIFFEQRGTRYAIPRLMSFELDSAIRESYLKNLNKDSMVVESLKRYKKTLEKRGIDLSGYNTDETVSDIHDLLSTLKINSVNLYGVSYSGGLMMEVLRRDPTRIRSLVLDSPLPTFIPIDEDEPANFNEALDILFRHVEKDSSDQRRYGNLRQRFRQYFTAITGKVFYIPYAGHSVQYTK